MTYLLKRGSRRRAHLAIYDRYGQVAGAWCGRNDYNLTSNVPWGHPTCKDCLRRASNG